MAEWIGAGAMTGTRVAIENLRDISRRCLAGRTLTTEQAEWLGVSLARFVDHDCRSTDDAFGLRFPQGGVPWWQEEAIRKRNAAIVELADRFLGHLPMSARVQRIHTLTVRYGASTWIHDRENGDMPEQYRGTARAYIWTAFSSGAKMPLTERQLRNILA